MRSWNPQDTTQEGDRNSNESLSSRSERKKNSIPYKLSLVPILSSKFGNNHDELVDL